MTGKFQVTLAALRNNGACFDVYNKVVRSLQGREFSESDKQRESYIRFSHKEPISILSILESNGLDDALWALRCIDNAGRDRDVRLYAVWCARQVEHMTTDQRSKDALDIAELHANGTETDEELAAARDAAWEAAWYASCAAASASASAAAWEAAWEAAMDAARDAQKAMLIAMCNGNAPWQANK